MRKLATRIASLLLVATIVLTLFLATAIQTQTMAVTSNTQDIQVHIDGVPLEIRGTPPVIQNGRTLVGIRDVFEALGFDIGWDGSVRMVRLTRSYVGGNTFVDTRITFIVGEPYFDISHEEVVGRAEIFVGRGHGRFDVPAQIINGSTMLPLRALIEAIGYQVSWDGTNRIVHIITTNPTTPIFYDGPHGYVSAENQARRAAQEAEEQRIQELREQREQMAIGTNALICRNELTPEEFVQGVFDYVNIWRVQLGLHPYSWCDTLAQAAQVHSDSQAEHGYMAHHSYFTGSPTDRARAVGFDTRRYGVSEVITNADFTPSSAIYWFYASPDHNFFITQNFPIGTVVGIAVAEWEDTFYFVTVKIGSAR